MLDLVAFVLFLFASWRALLLSGPVALSLPGIEYGDREP
jgi:hypothetical protein